MAAVISRLRESLSATRIDRDRIQEEIDATKPRYLFSAVLRLDCRYDPCGFQWIEPGEIHPVTTWYYMTDNVAKFTGIDDDDKIPNRIMKARNAAVIARRIVERENKSGELETGVVLLDELTGLDPAEREADGELILELQQTLLPDGLMRTGAEQVAWLEALQEQGFSGPRAAEYRSVCNKMLIASRQAVEYAEAHYADVVNGLSQRASGNSGYHNRAGKEDARLIQWAGHAVPQLSSPMVKAAVEQFKAAPTVAPVAVPQAQCDNCGTFVNLLTGGRLPKLCVGCGVEFAKPEEVEMETPEALSRRERLQAESRERKGK